MLESVVSVILVLMAIYVLMGLVFTIPFLAKGIEKVDEGAQGGTWGFKVIIIPGVVMLWPVLLKKWIKNK